MRTAAQMVQEAANLVVTTPADFESAIRCILLEETINGCMEAIKALNGITININRLDQLN